MWVGGVRVGEGVRVGGGEIRMGGKNEINVAYLANIQLYGINKNSTGKTFSKYN